MLPERSSPRDPHTLVVARGALLAFGITACAVLGNLSVATSASNDRDRIARWFAAGRCAAFDAPLVPDNAPLAKRDNDGIIFDPLTAKTRGFFYDPKSHAALAYPSTDSAGTFTLRVSVPPPIGVPRHDLGKLHTASGLRLGSTAAAVVRSLGKPKIVRACGLARYVYLRSEVGEPTSLQFTIRSGRVVEIFEDFGG
jgi:hypothetical protein